MSKNSPLQIANADVNNLLVFVSFQMWGWSSFPFSPFNPSSIIFRISFSVSSAFSTLFDNTANTEAYISSWSSNYALGDWNVVYPCVFFLLLEVTTWSEATSITISNFPLKANYK